MKRQFFWLITIMAFCGSASGESLFYQDRGDRSEGIKARPVSGFDIELLAVIPSRRGAQQTFGELETIQFVLPEYTRPPLNIPQFDQDVHVYVRRLQLKSPYYMLDTIVPDSPWEWGSENQYSWPTREVLEPISDQIRPRDLVGFVRLGPKDPSARDVIVPLRFFENGSSTNVEQYQFWFILNGRAEVSAKIFQASDGRWQEVWNQGEPKNRSPRRPFPVEWSSIDQPTGWYRLSLSMSVDGAGQDVFFYHDAEASPVE